MHVKRAIEGQEISYLSAVLVLIFSVYDFSECHLTPTLSRRAREKARKTHGQGKPAKQGFSEHASQDYFDSWRQRTEQPRAR